MATADSFGLFWNSNNGDRKYNADSLERWLKKFFTSGVFEGDLQVLASSGMTVAVQPGYCNLAGKVGLFENITNITLNAANSVYPRIDSIVIERNDVDREISLKVVQGSYTGDTPQPTAPIWSESDGIYQLVLAQIYIEAGASAVTQSVITDTRALNNLCGYITGTVEEVDFSQFAAQFTAYFNEFKSGNQADFEEWMDAQETDFMAWYDRMKGQLSEDAAGHLQQEIDGKEDLPTILTATLTAGETSLAFTDSHITNDCLIDVYTNVANVNPRNWAQSGTTITFTFKAQAVNVNVILKIREG